MKDDELSPQTFTSVRFEEVTEYIIRSTLPTPWCLIIHLEYVYMLYWNRKYLDCAESRCAAVVLCCSRIIRRETSVLFHLVNSRWKTRFPSDWTSTTWAGVNFTGLYTEVVDHVEIAILLWRFHHCHCFILGRIAPRPPGFFHTAQCAETLNCLKPSKGCYLVKNCNKTVSEGLKRS